MRRKALGLLIAVLMALSVVPGILPVQQVSGATYPSGGASTGVTVKKVSGTLGSDVQSAPQAVIDPKLIELLNELKDKGGSGELWVPIMVVSQYPLSDLNLAGIRMRGHATIAGSHVYLIDIKVSGDVERTLQGLAKVKGVMEIMARSDVRPLIETLKGAGNSEIDISEIAKFFRENNPPGLSYVYKAMLRTPTVLNGKKLTDMKSIIPKDLTVPEIYPLLEGKVQLGQRMKESYPLPDPKDAYAVYHLGSMDAWEKFNITGKNINVAVIDSGVDFGNPDLIDTYAVDTNPESPYYGWPIAFDSASMMDYLLYDSVFPNFDFFMGIMPWYTNTSYITGRPELIGAPYIIGYQGDTFATAFSGMSLANIPNATYRAYIINNVLWYLFNGTPTGTILLVDDDDGPNNNGTLWYDFEQYYTEALDMLGYNYTLYRVGIDGDRPNSTILSEYPVVIWFTGMNANEFTDEELANISSYLDSGGKLFLISTNFLDLNGFDAQVDPVELLLNVNDVPAPETDNSDAYLVTVTKPADELIVYTESANDSLDIDLYVFYNGTMVGYSEYIGPAEQVVIENPMLGNYTIVVYSYDNPGNTTYDLTALTINITPIVTDFAANYLHVDLATLDFVELGIPSVGVAGGATFRVSTINKGAVELGLGDIGVPYYYLVPSLTDFLADGVLPDENATVLSAGYMALLYNESMGYFPARLPINDDLSLPFSADSTLHIGIHPDLALALINTPPDSYYIYPGWVLAVDSDGDNVTDKVYVDLTNDWGYFVDFNDDEGHTKDNPVVAWDIFNTVFIPGYGEYSFPGQDGYPDISGGMIYYIADGQTPIPYSQQVYERWGLGDYGVPEEKLTPADGSLVAFMLGTIYAGGLEHGTLCAAAISAQGRTVGPAEFGLPANMYSVIGNAIDAKIIAEGDLYTMTSNWIDMMYFATEGYDGQPGTGDEAQITSNSYGRGLYYSFDRGFSFEDRFLMHLTKERPETVHFFASANEGPGYATGPSEGASPGVITVGAATEWGYRIAVGWNEAEIYGDVVEFSSRGPNALGQPKPDILTTGMFGLGSTTLNIQVWRSWPVLGGKYANEVWSGTSLATPMAAGIGALVAEAFYQAHGRYPTTEEMRAILMSSAENVYNDVLSQGAGYVNATKAVEIALEAGGILATPSKWQAGSYKGEDYPAFPLVLYPGESDVQTFTLKNYYDDSVDVKVSAGVLQKIGEVEIPIENVNATNWPFVPIEGYIPEGTQMMKVTVYPNVSTYGVDMLVRLYGDYGLIQQGGLGSVVSFTVKEPLSRSESLDLQIRQYGDVTFNGTIKLEFYEIAPWSWLNIRPTSIDILAKGETQFKATLTVPEDAPYGLYEGAIYVDYGNGTITIPVSVLVASPTPEFSFGGAENSTGLYDNSFLYSTQGADYVKDARLYYFNVPEEDAENRYIIADVVWDGDASVYPALLQPKVDTWSLEYPDVFGPYGMVDSARGYMISSSESIVMAKAVPGLNALWVYTPYGMTPVIPFEGRVGLAKISAERWVSVKEPSGEMTFEVNVPEWMGGINAVASGFSRPIQYYGVTAPETGQSDYYFVNVTYSVTLDVVLRSDWDDIAGLDLDLYVYYNDNGTWEEVDSSLTWTSDESVTIDFPMPGEYMIEVYAWSNPVPGVATYDLSIVTGDGTELQVTNLTEVAPGKYLVTASYQLTEENLNATYPIEGVILIQNEKIPVLFRIPVRLLPSPVDVSISSIETNAAKNIGETYNVTVYVTNDGLLNATNVRVYLIKDGIPTELEAMIPVIGPSEVYKVSFVMPLADTEGHEYRIIAESADDVNTANNVKMVYVKAVDPTKITAPEEPAEGQENVEISESIGEAKITTTIATKRSYRVTVSGGHGALVTVLMVLPPDTLNYNVYVEDATLLNITENRTDTALLLYVTIRLHSPGEIKVSYLSRKDIEAINTINHVWSMLYHRYNSTFDELYQKAMELGVDNETLSKALALRSKAEVHYDKAVQYLLWTSVPNQLSVMQVLAMQHLSVAYSSIYKATKMLEEVIKELEGS